MAALKTSHGVLMKRWPGFRNVIQLVGAEGSARGLERRLKVRRTALGPRLGDGWFRRARQRLTGANDPQLTPAGKEEGL